MSTKKTPVKKPAAVKKPAEEKFEQAVDFNQIGIQIIEIADLVEMESIARQEKKHAYKKNTNPKNCGS